jgi:hypothetical protein
MTTAGFFGRMASNDRYFTGFMAQDPGDGRARDYAKGLEAFTPKMLRAGSLVVVGGGDLATLRRFRQLGRALIVVEPSAARRAGAAAEGFAVVDGAFENIRSLALPDVAGLWCGAALRHVPDDLFRRVMANVSELLPPRAPLFLTLPVGEGHVWNRLEDGADDAESLVQRYPVDAVERVLGEQNIEIAAQWLAPDDDGPWVSVVGVKN